MRKRLIIFTTALTLLGAMPGLAQKKSNVLDIKESITDNSIIFPESFEADTQALLEGWYMKNYTATDDRYRTAPDANVTDEILIERLKNIPSVIEMPYNQIVKKYIERYTKNGRKLVTACLGLGNYYLPIIEQALEAEGLPNELKYVPMIESAFNPNAVSRAGATGLWQFMLSAAKGYDMEVSSLVDERRDPYESSKKGAKLLKDLYNTYGKWDLAIAAYNCGPGNVNKAIRRAGGDPKQHDFWSIYNYLPSETRGYFPMFVAANYIMNYYQDHNISPVVPTKPLVTDTVGVASRINLNQISKVLDIPLDELRLLNPQFRNDIIPGSAKRQYMLILPSRQVAAYIMSEDEIKGYDAQKYARRVVAEPGQLPKESDIDNEVAQTFNENDNMVAQQPTADDTDADYRMVREASRQREQERQRELATNSNNAENKKVASPSAHGTTTVNAAGQTVHKVAAGESLKSIAELYRVSPDQLKIWNNLKRNSVRVGQQLVIKGGVTPHQNHVQTASYSADDAPAQAAAPAKPAAQAKSRRTSTSKAQATQAANAKADHSGNAKTTQTDSKADHQSTASKKSSKKRSKVEKEEQTASAKTGKKSGKKRNEEQQTTTKKSGKKDKNVADNSKSGKKSKRNKKKAEVSKPVTHEVKSGESLDRIAKKNGVSVEDLRKANKHVKGNTIHPGDNLTIPKASKSSKKSSAKESSKSSKKSSSKSSSSKKSSSKKKKK